jgi:hypothetical protein
MTALTPTEDSPDRGEERPLWGMKTCSRRTS